MTLAIIAVVALFTIAYPQTSPVHPGALSLRNGLQNESLECEDPGDEPASLDARAAGRVANFRLGGSYRCRRLVFTSKERNPLIERVLAAESLKAKTLALDLAGKREEISAPLGVVVHGELEPELMSRIATLYRVEIAGVLGVARVRHLEVSPPEPPFVDIVVRRVDAPDLISTSRLVTLRGGR